MTSSWTRQFLRAPVYAEALMTKEHYVIAGHCNNVSEGGCFFLSNDAREENDVFSVMFLLAQYPEFSSFTRTELFSLNREVVIGHSVRGKVVIRRSMKMATGPYQYGFGCKFINIDLAGKSAIDNYVKLYARNIVFVLNLFEGLDLNNNNVALIRSLTRFLGYPADMKLPFVRQKLLHDYQSLESGFRLSGI